MGIVDALFMLRHFVPGNISRITDDDGALDHGGKGDDDGDGTCRADDTCSSPARNNHSRGRHNNKWGREQERKKTVEVEGARR